MQNHHLYDALDLFKLDNRARRLTPRTQGNYAWCAERFVTWCEAQGATTTDALTPALVRRYMVCVQEQRTPEGKALASATAHNLVRVVKRFATFLEEEGELKTNPFARVQMPRIEQKVLRALTPLEVRRVLEACESKRDRALIGVLVDAGVRAAELCALDFRDLDPASGALVVRNGKGQKGRYVRIGAAAQKMVRAYLLTRRGLSALDPLFVGRAGARMTPNTLVQLMRRLKVRSGVQELGCHALRRTFALTALRAGMDLHTLRALMGHSNLEILKQYLDLGREDLEAAHERFSPLATITGARTA